MGLQELVQGTAEPCSRALAQARVYLGQLRSRVSPAGPEGGGRRDYLVEAARQLRLALERDVSEDYEEAFNHYQNGVDVLLRGVQVDPNKERREAVKRKITQYLRRAEEIFNCHLQRAAEGSNPTGYSSLRFRPIRTLSSAVENLRRCKVVGVIDKVQIVQDPATGETFILKSLPKSHVETRERQTIIPHGVPFMVKLLSYSVSEDSIFLHLEHVQGEWGQHCFPSVKRPALIPNLLFFKISNILLLLLWALFKPSGTLAGRMAWEAPRAAAKPPSSLLGQAVASQAPQPTEYWETLTPRPLGMPAVPGARSLLTSGQRQLRAGFAPPSSIQLRGPGPVARETSREAYGGPGQQPPSEQCGALAAGGQGRRAWAVREEQVRLWAAELLLALEGLHQQGVLCRDLNPRNLLLDAAGHIRLTFFGQWTEVEPQCCSRAQEQLYSAPEVGGIAEPTEAADCWSFGSLLYELLTGVPLSQNHPSGIQPHTQLHVPEGLSLAATSLLTELLQYNPKQRLGSGGGGMAKLKSHSFFSTVLWNKLVG
uniref:Ribosomal protein S6 kinase like 1 n=1 Tax=Amazona collaria TaxID=241587 RepID=A0A8B9FSG3_9PSIT